MRQRLLQHLSFAKPLRLALVLFTLLLTLPQNVWGDTETTYTFDQTATDKGNGTYSISSNSEAYSWTIQDLASGHTPVTNALGFSDVPAGGNLLFTIYSDFTLTGAFVSAEITYSSSNTSKQSVAIYKNTGSLNDALTYGNSTTQELVELTGSPKTIDLSGTQLDHQFFAGNKIVFYFSIEGSTTSGNGTISIQSIKITTTDAYGLTVAGTAVTASNAANVLGDSKVSYNATNNTLTMNGATIDYTSGDAITAMITNPLNVNILGTNSISCGDHKAFNTSGNLVFQSSGGASPGQLTITSTSNIDPQSFYTCAGTVTYQNSLVATNPTSTSVLIAASSSTDYGITIAGVAVTNANAAAITGTGITTGTVSYDATTNTLTLTDAGITSDNNALTYSGNTLLKIALNGTNSITATHGTYTINTTGSGNIKFVKATGASTAAKLTVSSGDGSQYVFNGTNPSLGSGLYWKPMAGNQMVITEDPEFIIIDNLIMTDNRTVSGDNSTGTITYSSSNKTLTIDGFQKNFGTQHAIKTGVSGLKVKLIGASTINCSADSTVFYAFSSSASIQFIKDDATSKLTMTGTDFDRFAANSVTYDGFIYYSSQTTKGITQAAAPELGKLTKVDAGSYYTFATIDYADSDKSGSDAIYKDASPVLKYSFDYADSQKQDVSDQAYPAEGIKMTDPGILTAWVEVGTYKGPEAKGVRFGFIENPFKMEFNGTSKEISITPAPTMTNPVTYSVRSDSQSDFDEFAVLNATNNKITINNCYKGNIGFTFSNTDGGYTSLNDSTNITFSVLPSKPTLSLGSGLYYPGQQITATPTVPDAAYNSYFQINGQTEAGYTQPYTYTFNSAGVFNVSTVTYFVRGGNTSPLFGEYVEAKIIINTKPLLNAMVENTEPYVAGHGQVGDIYIDIRGDQNNSDPLVLQTGCKLYYYIGSNKNNAVEYDPANHIRLTESNTVTAYIVYTDPTDATIVYESEPVSASYIVNQQMADPFGANQNYRTCYLDENYSLKKPDGIKVYIITGVSGNSVTTSAIDYIPSKKPVLLEKVGAAVNGYYNAETYTGAEANLSGNLLKYADHSFSSTGKEYVLYMNEFVKATEEIPDLRCYLDLSSVNASRGMYSIGDGSTSIREFRMENEERDEWYNLQGRRILQPTKDGLYIKNGKKVIVNTK